MKMRSRNPPKGSHRAEMGIPWFLDPQQQPWLVVPQQKPGARSLLGSLSFCQLCAMMLSASKEPVSCIPVGDIKLHPWFCLLHGHPHPKHNNMTREGADWGRLLPVLRPEVLELGADMFPPHCKAAALCPTAPLSTSAWQSPSLSAP